MLDYLSLRYSIVSYFGEISQSNLPRTNGAELFNHITNISYFLYIQYFLTPTHWTSTKNMWSPAWRGPHHILTTSALEKVSNALFVTYLFKSCSFSVAEQLQSSVFGLSLKCSCLFLSPCNFLLHHFFTKVKETMIKRSVFQWFDHTHCVLSCCCGHTEIHMVCSNTLTGFLL